MNYAASQNALARLQADLRFRAAPLDLRGVYRMLLDFVDRGGRITATGLDAGAVIAAALVCSLEEARAIIDRCVALGLLVRLDNGVELLVAAREEISHEEFRARVKRLNADFSYRGLRDAASRRAWLVSDAGRLRLGEIGLTVSQAEEVATNAGMRGRRPHGAASEMQNNDRRNTDRNTESNTDSNTESREIVSEAIVTNGDSRDLSNAETCAESNADTLTDRAVGSPSEVPSLPSLPLPEVLPSHTLPSPTSPEPTQTHPPTTPFAARAPLGVGVGPVVGVGSTRKPSSATTRTDVATTTGITATEFNAAVRERLGARIRPLGLMELEQFGMALEHVSERWSEQAREPVSREHWMAFVAWLDKGGDEGRGGLSWWKQGKPSLGWLLRGSNLADKFDEAMLWWPERRRQSAPKSTTASAPNAIAAPKVSEEERAKMRASAASALEKLRARAGRSTEPTKRPTESR